jgi:hypothetical protein
MKLNQIIYFLFFLLLTLQTQAQTKLSIVFIGNSITQGKGGDNGLPPPTHAVNYLKEQKGIEDVLFINVRKEWVYNIGLASGEWKVCRVNHQSGG